jgi:hypothetical protein
MKARAVLVLIAGASPVVALADPPIATAEDAVAAYDAEFDAVMARTRTFRRCPRDGDSDDIVVCGRIDDSRMRVPYEPVPGEVHRIAGDLPTGRDAMAAGQCLRLCPQPVMIDLIGAVRTIVRGVDRLLHPDER